MMLKEFLKTNRINQKEFARRLDTTEAAISQYITGKRTPTLEMAVRIAELTLGAVSPAEMLINKDREL